MKKKILLILSIIIVLFISFMIFDNKNNYFFQSNETKEEYNSKLNQQIALQKIKEAENNANKVITEISNNVELILYVENGIYEIDYDKNKDEWYNSLWDSKINLKLNYQTIICIPFSTYKINLENNNGIILYSYKDNDIYCKSIEFNDNLAAINKGLFGNSYSPEEILSILDIAKEEIKKESITKQVIIKSKQTLFNYITNLCEKYNLKCRNISNETNENIGNANLV